jgi:PAS domain S-box-containing protein
MKKLANRIKSGTRFSTLLITSFVAQTTGCVLIISLCFYFYFDRRLTVEFQDKLKAQQGQTELILEKRMEQVQRRLRDLSLDNTIRVTMMLGVTPQLEERITNLYQPENGIHFFIQPASEWAWLPAAYPGLDKELIRECLNHSLASNNGKYAGNDRLVWYFSTPVMRRTELLGSAFVIYDPLEDRYLLETLRQTMDDGSDLAIRRPEGLLSVLTGSLLPLSPDSKGSPPGPFLARADHLLLPLEGFPEIFFLASRENLEQEKQKLFLLLGLFSILVMGLSSLIGVLVGRQMSKPLRKLAAKAEEISDLKKESLFQGSGLYREFNQLSQAFNSMIISLSEEKSRYTELLRNIDDAVYILDEDGRMIEANEATLRHLEYSSLPRERVAEFLPAAYLDVLLSHLKRTADGHMAGITIRSVHLTASGKRVPVEINSRVITYQGKNVVLNVARDLSSRLETEKALMESEKRYRSILDNIEESYFEIDFGGTIFFCNHAFSSLLGTPAEKIQGAHHGSIAEKEASANLSSMIELIRKTGTPARLANYGIIRPDGGSRVLDLSISLIRDTTDQPLGIRCVGRDITEQLRDQEEKQRLKQQLQRSLRLEALGTLAGGIAHDFNNILAAVMAYADLSLLQKPQNPELRVFLDRIKKAGIRGRDLVAQILAFSRQGETTRKPLDIVPVIKETLRMLTPSLPEQIRISSELNTGAGMILADPTQIHQVMMNLCLNARDAMRDGGGLLTIELDKVNIDAEQVHRFSILKTGDHLRLRVSDSGTGIPGEALEHIFEPFYTTKKPSEGTGMGLAVVHGIVSRHEGEILVTSTPGQGTCFEIHFPLVENTSTAQHEMEPPVTPGNSQFRILVVDDEEDFLQAVTRIIKHLGFQVESRTSSREALDLFRASPDHFHLVITDQVMPELTGTELAQEILKTGANIPVVLFTGYNEAVSAENAHDKGIRKYALKPLTVKDIADIINEAISEPSC